MPMIIILLLIFVTSLWLIVLTMIVMIEAVGYYMWIMMRIVIGITIEWDNNNNNNDKNVRFDNDSIGHYYDGE